MRLEPTQRGVGHVCRGALVVVRHAGPVSIRGHIEVVEVEPLVQPETGVHDEAPDEGGGVVALGLQNLRERNVVLSEPIRAVVVNLMVER